MRTEENTDKIIANLLSLEKFQTETYAMACIDSNLEMEEQKHAMSLSDKMSMLEKLEAVSVEDIDRNITDETVAAEIRHYVGSKNYKTVADCVNLYNSLQPYNVSTNMLLKRTKPTYF